MSATPATDPTTAPAIVPPETPCDLLEALVFFDELAVLEFELVDGEPTVVVISKTEFGDPGDDVTVETIVVRTPLSANEPDELVSLEDRLLRELDDGEPLEPEEDEDEVEVEPADEDVNMTLVEEPDELSREDTTMVDPSTSPFTNTSR